MKCPLLDKLHDYNILNHWFKYFKIGTYQRTNMLISIYLQQANIGRYHLGPSMQYVI